MLKCVHSVHARRRRFVTCFQDSPCRFTRPKPSSPASALESKCPSSPTQKRLQGSLPPPPPAALSRLLGVAGAPGQASATLAGALDGSARVVIGQQKFLWRELQKSRSREAAAGRLTAGAARAGNGGGGGGSGDGNAGPDSLGQNGRGRGG